MPIILKALVIVENGSELSIAEGVPVNACAPMIEGLRPCVLLSKTLPAFISLAKSSKAPCGWC